MKHACHVWCLGCAATCLLTPRRASAPQPVTRAARRHRGGGFQGRAGQKHDATTNPGRPV